MRRVRTVGRAQHGPAYDLKVLAELVSQLALPLKSQVGGGDDQDAFDQPASLEFLDQQAGHDGLAGARVVGQQETDARGFDEIVVNGLELVGQRVDAGDREGEIGVGFDHQSHPYQLQSSRGSRL